MPLSDAPALIVLLLFLAAPGVRAADAPPNAARELSCPADTTVAGKYVVLLANAPAGAQFECRRADGSAVYTFAYNDRGHGAAKVAHYVLNGAGLPSAIEIDGHNHLNVPVRERFAVTGKRAEWSNTVEQGTTSSSTNAFYVALDGVPAGTAVLARALSSNGGRLALLPTGEAHGEQILSMKVEAAGRSMDVFLYAVSGLDFAPTPVWLDAQGRFFGTVDGWLQVILDGWEPAVSRLVKAQEEWEARRSREIVARLAHRPEHAVAITGARVFDAEAGTTRQGWTVLFEVDRILAVGPDSEVQIPAEAERIQAAGKTLLPGLWDMHVHLDGNDGLLHLAAGVTSVRDLANERRILDDIERRVAVGDAVGPRVVRAGFIDGRGPNQGPVQAFADNADEVSELVREYAANGYTQVKLYNSFDPALVPLAAAETHRRGLRLSGHVPANMDAETIVRAGYDEIQHMVSLFWGLIGGVDYTNQRARLAAAADRAGSIDLRSSQAKALLQLLRERRTVVDPTLALFESWLTARPGHVDPAFAAVADRLPVQVRRRLFRGGLPVPSGHDAAYRRSFKALEGMLAALYRQGTPIVAGTDGMPGFLLHRELELYVESGLPPAAVLSMATLGAARVAGRSHLVGVIAPGKLADLALVDGDPSRSISDVRKVRLVVKGGVMHDPAVLLAQVGVRPGP
jgi:amidohydrolase family protein